MKTGKIIDDVVIMRLEEDKYWVSTLYASKMDDWWYYNGVDYDVEWNEITDEWEMYAIQGPKSKEFTRRTCKRLYFRFEVFFSYK